MDDYPPHDNQNLFDDICASVRRITGRGPQIMSHSRLLHDLKITGDDAYELLDEIEKKYDVDWSGFVTKEYFPDEGKAIWWWLKDLLGIKDKAHKEMTVGDLVRAAKAGRWQEK